MQPIKVQTPEETVITPMSKKSGKSKGPSKAASSGRGGSGPKGKRSLNIKVKSAKGRKLSSTLWLQRQLNDPYVQRAKDEGYRSRAAFKLLEIDDQFKLIRPGMTVIDLGAAPGGWSQVAATRCKSETGTGHNKGEVIAIDISEMDDIPGVTTFHLDFMDDSAPDVLKAALRDGGADIVMSDMAAPATGHKQTDHLRIMGLAEAGLEFALEVLKPGGIYLAKVLQGGTENELLTMMKKNFEKTRHVKPDASRADSSELYVLAIGFKNAPTNEDEE